MKDLEMQLIEFQSSSIWKQNFVDLGNDLETIEKDRFLGQNCDKNAKKEK